MSSAEFTVGDVVDIHIRGARVMGTDDFGLMRVLVGHWQPIINVRNAGVTIERAAPANWPPQANDVWSDGEPDDLPGSPCEWHVLPRRLGSDELVLHLDSSSPGMTPADFVAQYPNARLVRRREVPETEGRQWAVRHPGLGVLPYGTEQDAWNAAGTAGTVLYRDSRTESWQEPA